MEQEFILEKENYKIFVYISLGQENKNDFQKTFEDVLEYAVKNFGKMAFDEAKKFASKVCKELLKENPAIFGLDALSLTGNLLDNLSKSLTEKQLENVKPMIFQLET